MTESTEEKTNTTPERIAELRELWAAADLDLPIRMDMRHDGADYGFTGVLVTGGGTEATFYTEETARLVEAALIALPDLLAEVERLSNALAIKTEVARSNQRVVESYAEEVERVSRDLAEAQEEIKSLHASTVPQVMYDKLKELRDEAHAEVERMRPVVEAAKAWRALLAGPPEPYHRAQVRDLIAAIDAYGSDPMASSPDEHPEERCHRCGGPNVHAWCAPSPLWNQVMRGGDINNPDRFDGIVCTVCFAQLAEDEGIASFWRFYAERVHVELATTTPSGRVWNERKWLWEDVSDVHRPTGYLPIGSPNSEACQVCDEPWPCADAASPETIRRVAVVLSGEQPPAQPTTSEE